MDCSPPGSSVHGILQARGLEWVTIPFSRGSSPPRDRAQVSRIAGRFCAIWGTRVNGQEGLLMDSRGGVLCGWGPDFLQGGLPALGSPYSLLCCDLPLMSPCTAVGWNACLLFFLGVNSSRRETSYTFSKSAFCLPKVPSRVPVSAKVNIGLNVLTSGNMAVS